MSYTLPRSCSRLLTFLPRCYAPALLLAALAIAGGCAPEGPPLGQVTGIVTLDGEPLPEARVEFQPVDRNGSPSFATTAADGSYTLEFGHQRMGAMVGEHEVRVSTHRQLSTDEGGGFIPERVPPRYNDESTLRKTVEPGENVIPLDLTTN